MLHWDVCEMSFCAVPTHRVTPRWGQNPTEFADTDLRRDNGLGYIRVEYSIHISSSFNWQTKIKTNKNLTSKRYPTRTFQKLDYNFFKVWLHRPFAQRNWWHYKFFKNLFLLHPPNRHRCFTLGVCYLWSDPWTHPLLLLLSLSLSLSHTHTHPNSKHWFTTSFLQPLPYLVTPYGPENCQLTSSFLLVLKQK